VKSTPVKTSEAVHQIQCEDQEKEFHKLASTKPGLTKKRISDSTNTPCYTAHSAKHIGTGG